MVVRCGSEAFSLVYSCAVCSSDVIRWELFAGEVTQQGFSRLPKGGIVLMKRRCFLWFSQLHKVSLTDDVLPQ